jgi:hypothetical protein
MNQKFKASLTYNEPLERKKERKGRMKERKKSQRREQMC